MVPALLTSLVSSYGQGFVSPLAMENCQTFLLWLGKSSSELLRPRSWLRTTPPSSVALTHVLMVKLLRVSMTGPVVLA
ncbi:hypothetical protein SAVIM40S_03262 [Streptomyces avidinii]